MCHNIQSIKYVQEALWVYDMSHVGHRNNLNGSLVEQPLNFGTDE